MDHEGPITHLVKFYEITRLLGVIDSEEESVFMKLIPHFLIEKARSWYLDQTISMLTNWNALEYKSMSRKCPNHVNDHKATSMLTNWNMLEYFSRLYFSRTKHSVKSGDRHTTLSGKRI